MGYELFCESEECGMKYRVNCPECGFEYELQTNDTEIKSELELCECGGKCNIQEEEESEGSQ